MYEEFLKESMALNENVLVEHAIPLKQAKDKVIALGEVLVEHFALIGMLGKENENYVHWVKEIANFCKQLDNIKIKGNKKFDADFFIDEFMYHLDTDKDAEIDVNAAWVTHCMPDITKYDFSREDYHKYKEFRNECFEELPVLFASKEDHDNEFFIQYIEDKISKFY